MTGLIGVTVLVASLVGAIAARRRIWGLRLVPATAKKKKPDGTVLMAAGLARGARMEVTPLLADWLARGVLRVDRRGPDLPGDPKSGSASGPEWTFTVEDAETVSAIEFPVLRTFVPTAPTPGASATLTREDKVTREAIASSISAAVAAQRAQFGPRPVIALGLAVLLVTLSVLGAIAAVAGFAIGAAGPVAVALAFLGGVAGIALVTILCRGGRRPSDAEREYRQDVRNLEAWVKSTNDPDPMLAGWAMLWDLPGAWAAGVPVGIASLRMRDRAFLPGDFNKGISTPTSI